MPEAPAVEELKRKEGGNIFVFGGANLSSTLIEHGLFDQYRLAVVPVVVASVVAVRAAVASARE